MTDTVPVERRSEIMRQVRSRDTVPEMIVRRLVFGMGYRYRLHSKDLPGKPDLVFPKRKKVIFVHGCFWHGHEGCKRARLPGTNREYWSAKIERNLKRDQQTLLQLSSLGWKSLVIWECALQNASNVTSMIEEFLDG
jgi:DNA mismatch endonuclease, patch repair protein